MRPIVPDELIERIEALRPLDGVGRPLLEAVRRAVPDGSARKDLATGTWLGHPLHPMLTDVVIGSWTSAVALDLLGGRRLAPAARRLVGLGVLSALPTAAAGLSDWGDVSSRSIRRIGLVHATGNTAALVLFASSWAVNFVVRRMTRLYSRWRARRATDTTIVLSILSLTTRPTFVFRLPVVTAAPVIA